MGPGSIFGRLTVLSEEARRGEKRQWLCQCACGKTIVAAGSNLTTGNTTSCGCLRLERIKQANTRHGCSGNGIYGVWRSMHQRCRNPNSPAFKDYGGRGIFICKRWYEFSNFMADMFPRPPGTQLERRENNGPYSPKNCYWATKIQQARNTRGNKLLTFMGETHCVAEWAERVGLSKRIIYARLDSGWSIDQALSLPRYKRRNHGNLC